MQVHYDGRVVGTFNAFVPANAGFLRFQTLEPSSLSDGKVDDVFTAIEIPIGTMRRAISDLELSSVIDPQDLLNALGVPEEHRSWRDIERAETIYEWKVLMPDRHTYEMLFERERFTPI